MYILGVVFLHYLIFLDHIYAGEALITLLDAKTEHTLLDKLRAFYKAMGKASPVTPVQFVKQSKGERFHHCSFINISKYQPENQCFLISGS